MTNKKISGVQLLRLSVAQKENFIAFAMTPWHAISIDASIAYLRSINQSFLHGVVMVEEHPESGICVSDTNFNKEGYSVYYPAPYGGTLEKFSSFKQRVKQIIHNRWEHIAFYTYALFGGINWFHYPTVYVISPVYPRTATGLSLFRMGRFAKFVTCDEGVGSYMFFEEEKPSTKSVRDRISYFRRIIIGHHWVAKCHKLIPTTLFLKHKEAITLNTPVAPFYKDVLGRKSQLPKDFKIGDVNNSIIICTSVREGDSFENDEDIKLWSRICSLLSKKLEHLILKPHPRDTVFSTYADEWRCDLLSDKQLSMEAICAHSHPKCIIGMHSSALVTASALYNIPVVCITGLYDLRKRSIEMVRGFNLYKELFSKLVFCPNNIDEFQNYINQLQ